ncbi:unnamed protein product [Trifolium pratense]|uniref:Uncharacterized protein n=1 Tax=Trifolium pratense TaxID=57577 RepID=A0ACB0KNQ9_TRIPR|nr:unnamed protein product [Trifolium pratense]
MDGSHWLVVHEPPFQIKCVEFYAQYYANLLAPYLGMSEKEAIKIIYSISLDAYCGFRAVLTEDTVEKLQGRDDIIMVIPDIYVKTLHKLYAGNVTLYQ